MRLSPDSTQGSAQRLSSGRGSLQRPPGIRAELDGLPVVRAFFLASTGGSRLVGVGSMRGRKWIEITPM
jgi:hypothetical protein